ncbi:Mannoside phosphorylase like protein [Aduncisulcus paluster]|uniref:Mannoside phosphorylase like protein n=1 Tax=Aduncisulcus paluster TaxID=2918883 RepID=A0ABQ5K336_9EUKA|nr:Mannoside phosphorylase like protein [Aduncisulcus paluster]
MSDYVSFVKGKFEHRDSIDEHSDLISHEVSQHGQSGLQEDDLIPIEEESYSKKCLIVSASIIFGSIFIFIIIVCCVTLIHPPKNTFSDITCIRDQNDPWLEKGALSSVYDYNYNSAYFDLADGSHAIAVRVQNQDSTQEDSWDVLPSLIALSTSSDNSILKSWSRISSDSVIMTPDDATDSIGGCEDPRILWVESEKLYFMFYTAVTYADEAQTQLVPHLALATSDDGRDWDYQGYLFPDEADSKSGALIVLDEPRDDGTVGLLLWGDSSIRVATTTDFYNYVNTGQVLIAPRDGEWDGQLVESGPPPFRLKDGNYLFFYNSAQQDGETIKPGYTLQYHVGYVILDGTTPETVLKRSDSPLLSPDLDWESCNSSDDVTLTPRVVFTEGGYVIDENTINLVYQGCDVATNSMTCTIEWV